jgi:iron(III) transport system permease protein
MLAGLLFLPLYVQAAAWNGAIGTGGWLTQRIAGETYAAPWLAGWTGAIWIHAMGALPWMALLGAASLRTVERRLEEEALLDGRPLAVLMRVSLRRGGVGFWAATMWTVVVCATEIAVTDLFQIRTFAEEIYTEATLGPLGALPGGLLKTDLAIGVAIIGAGVGVAIAWTVPWLPRATTIPFDASWRWRPELGVRRCISAIAWALAMVLLAPPLGALMWRAGIAVTQYEGTFLRSWSLVKAFTMIAESPWEHRREWGWSLAIGVIAAMTTMLIAVALSWLARRPGWRWPLAGAVALTLAVPAPLWGVWVIGLLNHSGDSIWTPLTVLYDRTLLAPVMVQVIRTLPIVGLWVWAQLSSVPTDLLEAARIEGAGGLAQLLRVAMPLRRVGIAAAAGMALALSVSELSATLLVLPPGVTTISVRIFQLLHYGVDDRVAALALSVIAAMLLVGGAVAIFMARGRRQVSPSA